MLSQVITRMNIPKFASFVILTAAVAASQSACSRTQYADTPAVSNSRFIQPVIVGHIADRGIDEASGLAASRCQDGVYWTHNDSGGGAFIYAINEKGETLGAFHVPNAGNVDWEDIASYKDSAGKCSLLIADTGDKRSKKKGEDQLSIYRIAEPELSAEDKGRTRENALDSPRAERMDIAFAEGPSDAETLMVHPKTGDIYIVTKRHEKAASVYKFAQDFSREDVITSEKIADIKVPAIPFGFVTGGDIAPDGRHLVICDYVGAYEWNLPDAAASFDEIWKQAPQRFDAGRREGGEAICYTSDGSAVLTTTEGENPPIYKIAIERK